MLWLELTLISLAILAYPFLPVGSPAVPLALIGWFSLWRRGLGWREMGLRRPQNWRRTVALGGGAGVLLQAFSAGLINPLLTRLAGPPDLGDYALLEGNLLLFLITLLIMWLTAAFAEEVAFRGYLLNRLADGVGWPLALVITTALFGWVHLGAGAASALEALVTGLMFGLVYLANSRNLWTAVLAHGVSNTLALLLIYLGLYG